MLGRWDVTAVQQAAELEKQFTGSDHDADHQKQQDDREHYRSDIVE
jgi:hypothetical protein